MELKFKKVERRPIISISVDKTLNADIRKAAKKEGISISSFIGQAVSFVLSQKEKNN